MCDESDSSVHDNNENILDSIPENYEEAENDPDVYDRNGKTGELIIIEFKGASSANILFNKDRADIKNCFSNLQYEINTIIATSKKDIDAGLSRISQKDFSNKHSIVVVILSNIGVEATVRCPNGELITTKDFLQPFYAQNCPTLRGKPKVFIFQAYNYTHLYEADKMYPSENDFLFVYSIVQGDLARRQDHMPHGSWFIEHLVKNIAEFVSEDFINILTRTFSDVYRQSMSWKTSFVYKKVPCLVSTLIKRFYLYKQDEKNYGKEKENNVNEEEGDIRSLLARTGDFEPQAEKCIATPMRVCYLETEKKETPTQNRFEEEVHDNIDKENNDNEEERDINSLLTQTGDFQSPSDIRIATPMRVCKLETEKEGTPTQNRFEEEVHDNIEKERRDDEHDTVEYKEVLDANRDREEESSTRSTKSREQGVYGDVGTVFETHSLKVNLLLPTMLMIITICAILYLYIYEQKFVLKLLNIKTEDDSFTAQFYNYIGYK